VPWKDHQQQLVLSRGYYSSENAMASLLLKKEAPEQSSDKNSQDASLEALMQTWMAPVEQFAMLEQYWFPTEEIIWRPMKGREGLQKAASPLWI
jgi:hypothetical protein